MKEHPILFSGQMVRAILEGKKTVTRRLPGLEEINKNPSCFVRRTGDIVNGVAIFTNLPDRDDHIVFVKCPYGQPGDRIWVRETYLPDPPMDNTWDYYQYNDGGGKLNLKAIPRRFRNYRHCIYLAGWNGCKLKWRPSIFMPRWASRILLEVINVRVERLQDITDDDAKAEGMTAWHDTANGTVYRPEFELLWQSINGKTPGHSWNDNPWVWVIEFRKA